MAPGTKRFSRVSWAPEQMLRQVRLFVSEDAPAISGLGVQVDLQAKASSSCHTTGFDSQDSLPPGFGGSHLKLQMKKETSKIPVIQWRCPQKLALNHSWLVVAGEESKEVKCQNQRQVRTLEAIYPRPSFIPPNPCVPPGVQYNQYDDAKTPHIPIIAIEDEEPEPSAFSLPIISPAFKQSGEPVTLPDYPASSNTTSSLSLPLELSDGNTKEAIRRLTIGLIPGAVPDVAAAAFTAIVKSNDKNSLIDQELLIKILSDPNMVQKLISQYKSCEQISPEAKTPKSVPLPSSVSEIPHSAPMFASSASLAPSSLLPVVSEITTKHVKGTGHLKNQNYYKTLIQMHGGMDTSDHDGFKQRYDREAEDSYQSSSDFFCDYNGDLKGSFVDTWRPGLKHRDSQRRIPKRCAFFNTPRGCRNGSKCPFVHDLPYRRTDNNSVKRTKLDTGIAGEPLK